VDYFAVSEKLRGKGYGEMMLKAIIQHYEGRGVFLEIEVPYEWADNYNDRLRRRSFYVDRVGLTPMGTTAKLFGVDMELLGSGCHLTYDEYRNFYLNNYGRFAYDNITKTDGKS
jgi:GNAT superfamily N-acetyltransferase